MMLEPANPYSCPWCLHPPSFFTETADGRTACEKCNSVIPVNQSWYRRGEKIISVREAAQRYS